MNNRFVSEGIILSRINYSEADKIISFLTPEHGKVNAIAKGVRKQKSKLAGGIELFSVSNLTFLIGRGKINTLISTRLVKNFSVISSQLERCEAGYEVLRLVNKSTEDNPEPAYYHLLKTSLESLNSESNAPMLVVVWLKLQLLTLSGHTPNLGTDTAGHKLDPRCKYNFDTETMHFIAVKMQGLFGANHIKLLRLIQAAKNPSSLSKLQYKNQFLEDINRLSQDMTKTYIGV